jgi:hypothetical protein
MSQALDFYQALKNKDAAQARRIMDTARAQIQAKEMAMIEQDGSTTVDDVLGLPATNSADPKRKYSRRATASEKIADRRSKGGSQTATSVKTDTLTLTGDQLVKLWQLTTGGRLIIDDTSDGTPVYYVSFDSLQAALPKILETL